ncbi:MAG TPA: glycosyltransferase [Polyangiaceae bacterium]|nr:glycosyltransferase [Polyangiaceae bacterium]
MLSAGSNEPWLSVVVPWWGRPAYVRETLESMASQTEGGFECLIIDRGPEDSSSWLEPYRGRFDFRLVTTSGETDWMSKTNVGFQQARGRFCCMLHTDDVWRPQRVARLRAAVERHPEAGLIFHPVRFVNSKSRLLGEWHAPLPTDRLLDSAEVLQHLIVQNFISCPAPLLRKDLLGPGIDPALWYTGDWELYLRVASAAPCVYIDELLADFRLHTSSLTMQRSRSAVDFRAQLDQIPERFAAALPEAERARLLRIARFSNAVNVALAGAFHGQLRSLGGVLSRASGLGLQDYARYLRDSRIVERTRARLRLALR